MVIEMVINVKCVVLMLCAAGKLSISDTALRTDPTNRTDPSEVDPGSLHN